ncbi:MAG: hypothetical protein IID46_16425 [Planctomycetes bacterium]|nr:hypothetical protein [Planctomycetota bacterium]
MAQPGFFVYVIESPSAQDLYHPRSEADLLRQAINLDHTPCVTRCAISRDAFNAALIIGLVEEKQKFPNLLPILHISAHGNSEGIGLSNGDSIGWDELRLLLQPINAALQGYLLVCMSCCEGYAGSRMAMFTDNQPLPFYALIGNSGSPTWSDTAVAYATFYHLLARGYSVDQCVINMRISSGEDTFFLSLAAQEKQDYIAFVQNQNAQRHQTLLDALRQNQQQTLPDQMAKLRKLEPAPTGNAVKDLCLMIIRD